MAKQIVVTEVKQTVYDGILCPNPDCRAVAESYKGGQNKKTKDCITRKKTCLHCGTIFETVEVPVKIVTLKNEHIPAVSQHPQV